MTFVIKNYYRLILFPNMLIILSFTNYFCLSTKVNRNVLALEKSNLLPLIQGNWTLDKQFLFDRKICNTTMDNWDTRFNTNSLRNNFPLSRNKKSTFFMQYTIKKNTINLIANFDGKAINKNIVINKIIQKEDNFVSILFDKESLDILIINFDYILVFAGRKSFPFPFIRI